MPTEQCVFSDIVYSMVYCTCIRKYGSTFYIIIGIAMVILPYFGPMRKLKFQFSL